jgi:hypothetical protein
MTDLLSAPLRPALALYRDFALADPEAVAEVRALFSAEAECWLCDAPAGNDFSIYVTEDPVAPKTTAMIAPLCARCMSLPTLQRWNRIRKVMIATFPNVNPRNIRMIPMAALRRLP